MNSCKSDKNRWGGGRVLCAQYRLLWLKRCCERYVGNPVIYPLIWFIYHRMQVKYGVDIPARTKIGPGFKIEHLYGIVLNPDV